MAVAGDYEGDYLPIAEHGLVGDLHTVALVGTNGTIDWYCCPAFDSPSVFGRSSTPTTAASTRSARRRGLGVQAALLPGHQRPHHALLHPRRRRRGAGLHADRGAPELHRHRLIRRVIVVRGEMRVPDRGAAALRLRARAARGRDAPARRAVPRAVADAGARGRDREDDGPERRLGARAGRAWRRSRCRPAQSQAFVLERVPQDHICRPFPERETAPRSRRRSRTGAAGSSSRATAGAGARWSTARR